jgi:hypothetical protein
MINGNALTVMSHPEWSAFRITKTSEAVCPRQDAASGWPALSPSSLPNILYFDAWAARHLYSGRCPGSA